MQAKKQLMQASALGIRAAGGAAAAIVHMRRLPWRLRCLVVVGLLLVAIRMEQRGEALAVCLARVRHQTAYAMLA